MRALLPLIILVVACGCSGGDSQNAADVKLPEGTGKPLPGKVQSDSDKKEVDLRQQGGSNSGDMLKQANEAMKASGGK